jgi:hypothetical protein
VEKPRDAALAGSVKHDFRAPTIYGLKVILVRYPHAWQRGKVVNLRDVIERFADPFRVEHRSRDILRPRCGAWRRTKVENAHAMALREKCSH